MTRLRPSPDALVCGLLRPALSTEYGATVAPKREQEWLTALPYVAARAVDGDADRNLELKTTAEIDVQSWAEDRALADDLDDLALRTLRAALRRGTVAAGGRIVALRVVRLGSELATADQPGGVYRWQASYSIDIRPARP